MLIKVRVQAAGVLGELENTFAHLRLVVRVHPHLEKELRDVAKTARNCQVQR